MTVLLYAVIAIFFVVAGIGGNIVLDQWFSRAVGDRPFTVNGRRVESEDPFVRGQFRKFYALRVAYSVTLLVLLLVVVSNVG